MKITVFKLEKLGFTSGLAYWKQIDKDFHEDALICVRMSPDGMKLVRVFVNLNNGEDTIDFPYITNMGGLELLIKIFS